MVIYYAISVSIKPLAKISLSITKNPNIKVSNIYVSSVSIRQHSKVMLSSTNKLNKKVSNMDVTLQCEYQTSWKRSFKICIESEQKFVVSSASIRQQDRTVKRNTRKPSLKVSNLQLTSVSIELLIGRT